MFKFALAALLAAAPVLDPNNPATYDIPDTYIVDLKDNLGTKDVSSLAGEYGLEFVPTALEKDTKEEVATIKDRSLIDRLLRDGRVEGVEPLSRMYALGEPNDPLYKKQWHLKKIGTPRAWDFSTGKGVTVAVIDTGIGCEDFGGFKKLSDLHNTECVGGWNFVSGNEHANDDHGHGSHVAGTIAQSTNNDHGGAGIAYHVKLMPIKVLGADGSGTTADIADAVRWSADHGADVINMSLGGPRDSAVLQKAINYAVSKGVTVVAAAGNSGGSVGYPGANRNVVCVSASDQEDKLAKFSSRGDTVDIAAPGVEVMQQTVGDGGRGEKFEAFNGTSMASPHVAGVAAMVVSLGITNPSEVENALKNYSRKIDPSDAAKKLYGSGVLTADDTVKGITFKFLLMRVAFLLGLVYLVAQKLPTKVEFWLPAVFTSVGLLAFAPWVGLTSIPGFDLLARPWGDWDLLLVGVSLHKWLLLASAVIPFVATTLTYNVVKARPMIAGWSVGTAAYLISLLVTNSVLGPFGQVAMALYLFVNIAVCTYLAKVNFDEKVSG